jgi:RNA polymerase sigma-70 factor (ECF subfamily)
MSASELESRAARTLDDLYRRHVGEVFRYAYAMLGNRADAEDVAQTTFMNALRALERGERPRKPRSWLLAIAHNIVRQRFRQARARPTEVELDRELAGVEHDDAALTVDEMLKALARIPPLQREALVMREFEGRPYAEIAKILDISTSALETLLFRARRSLADELASVVTCEQAELAISRRLDERLSRKDRRRLEQHLSKCEACARFEQLQRRGRRGLRGLALVPLPASLTLFKGTNSAAAAALPTVGASAAAGTGVGAAAGGLAAGGLAAKAAAAVVALGVAGGLSYSSGPEIRDERTSLSHVKSEPAKASGLERGKAAKRLKAPAEARSQAKANGKALGKTRAAQAKAANAGRKNPPAREEPNRAVPRGSARHPDARHGTPSSGRAEPGSARTRRTKSTQGKTARGKTARGKTALTSKRPKAKRARPAPPTGSQKAQKGREKPPA